MEKSWLDKWRVVIIMSLVSFVIVLDTAMINVAVPALVRDLKTTVPGVQAAISFYALVMAAFMLAGGKFADVYGMKRLFVIGSIIYGIGAITAALAPNIGILIIGWSVIEGFGAALLLPITLIAVTLEYTGVNRAKAFAVIGGVQASAAAFGPIYGGFMTTALSWRWAFGSELIIIFLILIMVRHVKESNPIEGETVDWVGIFLSAAGLALIALGFIMSSQFGWWEAKRVLTIGSLRIAPFGLSVVPFLLALGATFLSAFANWQQKREADGETPLLRLGLLNNQRFVSAALASAMLNLILAGIFFTTPLFLQAALKLNALDTGIAMLPVSIGTLVFALSTAGLAQKFKPVYIIQVGFLIMIGGLIALWHVIRPEVQAIDLTPGLLIFGIGTGLVLGQITNVAQSAVSDRESGEASGFNNTVRQLGTSLGTALIGAIFLSSLYSGIAGSFLKLEHISVSPQVKQELVVDLQDAAQSFKPAEQSARVAELPKEERAALNRIIEKSWDQAKRTALLTMVFFVIFSMLVASFLVVKKQPDG